MSLFTTDLKVKALDNGKWELLESFKYHISDLESKEVIIIDAGFKTNFASVPRIFWVIYPPYDRHYGKASVLHDGMYASHLFKRSKCDSIFREAMKVLGANILTRNIIYGAVRAFGYFAYKNNKKLSKKVHYES